jgi:hypothetical protein
MERTGKNATKRIASTASSERFVQGDVLKFSFVGHIRFLSISKLDKQLAKQ